jgi:hypothetical protein
MQLTNMLLFGELQEDEPGLRQDLIEARYQDFEQSGSLGILTFEINHHFYEINFKLMIQKNLATDMLRVVERVKHEGPFSAE